MNESAKCLYYPRLLRRVQAMLIDSVFFILFFYSIAFLPPMGDWSFVKPLLLVAGVLALEPGLVSFTGCTIGQHWLEIRVTRLSGQGNINLLAATIRFLLKTALGWFSLVMVLTTRRHQALHDVAAKSLVVYRATEHLPQYEKLLDRPSLSDMYVMPSPGRRAAVTVAYFVAAFLFYVGITVWLVSEPCVANFECTAVEAIILNGSNLMWFIASCAIIVFGWRGQMYGCRRRPRN